MVYYSAGSKEEEIIADKLSNLSGNKVKKTARFKMRKPVSRGQEGTDFQETNVKRQEKVSDRKERSRLFKRRGVIFKRVLAMSLFLIVLVGGALFYRTSSLFSKISVSGGSIFGGLFKDTDDLGGMADGRINILLIGIRGQNIPGGSLLADTIMVLSIKPETNQAAMISIPRDLYVEIPGKNYSRKINEANPIGEGEGRGKGLELVKQAVEQVTGLPIHYAVSANFDALRDTVDVMGGITVHLDKPFYEGKQFVEGNECGGEFSLPAGDVKLSGEEALCYSRARFATSDFDRARRQQEVLMAIKDKALSIGTLSDFSKVNNLLDVMGDNIRTDMKPWEMQKLFEIFNQMGDLDIRHKVFDTTEAGLLVAGNNGSYILTPAAGEGNYSEIHQVCQNIFNDTEEEEAE